MGMTVDSYERESYALTRGLLAAHAWHSGADKGAEKVSTPQNQAAQANIDAIAMRHQERSRKPCPAEAAAASPK